MGTTTMVGRVKGDDMKLEKEDWEELTKVIQEEIKKSLLELAKEGKLTVVVQKTIVQRDTDGGANCQY